MTVGKSRRLKGAVQIKMLVLIVLQRSVDSLFSEGGVHEEITCVMYTMYNQFKGHTGDLITLML